MEVSKAHVERILKTLPIGYYLKRDVEVKLSDEDNSYYDFINDSITISYPTIAKVMLKLDDKDTEKSIRCLLYHEVSHTLLTPKMTDITDYLNVFEDERIETILKDYYHNVDFKEFVMRVNDFKFEEPKSAFEAFYQIVRYRVGPIKFTDRVKQIIDKSSNLNATLDADYYSYRLYDVDDYKYDVKRLYEDICSEWDKHSEEMINEFKDSKHQIQNNADGEGKGEASDIDTLSALNHLSKALNVFYDKNMIENISKILSKNIFSSKRNGSSINSYSGIFDIRSVMRDDYKYFTQKNRLGNIKQHSKLHLNLFIDVSGSFKSSELTVNKIIYSLAQLEKSSNDFIFDIVTCQMGQKIRAKSDRQIVCSGGNDLNEEIFQQFKQLQFTNYNNINIVLFDGDAQSDTVNGKFMTDKELGKNFKAFDTSNTTIISDTSNRSYISPNCSHCKVIYTNNYVSKLYECVLKSLDALVK